METWDARSALEAKRQAEAQMARAATCPPWRHAVFGLMMGGWLRARPSNCRSESRSWSLLLRRIPIIIHSDRKRMGMFINGYRRGKTRIVALGILASSCRSTPSASFAASITTTTSRPCCSACRRSAHRDSRKHALAARVRPRDGRLSVDVPTGFDAVLHPPARLQIAAVLAQAQEAEFALLKTITGASDSVMSKHLAALADAGYVALRKAVSDGRQRTWARLTSSGRAAFRRHVKALEALAAAVASEPRASRAVPGGVERRA